eukprot:2249150-Rhodomonas_salina.1
MALSLAGNFTLDFAFQNLFLLGSPVGFFLTSRDLVEWHECGSGRIPPLLTCDGRCSRGVSC